VLKLIPEGVIYGRISEDDGEHAGLPIKFWRSACQKKKKWQKSVRRKDWHETDEEGMFRIADCNQGLFSSEGPEPRSRHFAFQSVKVGAQGIPSHLIQAVPGSGPLWIRHPDHSGKEVRKESITFPNGFLRVPVGRGFTARAVK